MTRSVVERGSIRHPDDRSVPVAIRDRHGEPTGAVCHAPGMNLYLFANGDVGPCCRNRSYGNIATTGIVDLWNSDERAALAADLDAGRFPGACDLCEAEHRLEGREHSFSASFDTWRAELDAELDDESDGDERPDRATAGPERIEFELSNTCNLQCVQCNGELSSTIRAKREHRAPLPMHYGDDFLADLATLVPTLRRASFVGGEPFLVPIYDRIWALLGELAPDVECVVVTNGTVWNERVDALMTTLDIAPFVSIDGITPETYGAIRVGGDLERVLDHLDRFHDRATRRQRRATIVFCMMPENAHELADLLLHAEARGIAVTTSVVREPAVHSLGHLPADRLAELLGTMDDQAARLDGRLELNRATWEAELGRVRILHAEAASGDDRWSRTGPRILMFRRQGTGPTAVDAELDALRAHASDGRVHTLRVGPGDRAGACPPELAALIGLAPADIEGHALSVLQPRFSGYEVVEATPDRYEADVSVEHGSLRLVMVPDRGDDGWADDVVVAFAFATPGP